MRALTFDGDGRVALRDVDEPSIQHPTDAIVEVMLAGICATDTHAVARADASLPRGTVLGHEFVGRVAAVGPAVTTFVPGDIAVGSDFTACGHCWYCMHHRFWQCPHRQVFGTGEAFGQPLPGCLAEAVRVPFADTTLGRLADGVDPESAIFATDTLATAASACDVAHVRPATVVAVIGAGPVGQMVNLAAQAFGASAVLVSEPAEDRRLLVDQLGGVGVTPAELVGACRSLTDGRGADVAIEAVGSQPALDAAVSAVRGAGHVVSVGVPGREHVQVDALGAFANELNLHFVLGDPIRERNRCMTLLRTGHVDPLPVIGTRVDLDAAGEAFQSFARGETLKAVVRCSPLE